MKYFLLLILTAMVVNGYSQTADSSEVIHLWPADRLIKNTDGHPFTEHNMSKPGDPIIRLTDISDPTIKIYKPVKANGDAVIVCPGGGYSILAINLEGEAICTWFNSFGVTAILLKYRVPAPAGMRRDQLPLQDAQRAMGLVRARASKWGIRPDHIGIMGFSAGGHLSASLSNHFMERTYPAVDSADGLSCRPDFTILIYPAYLVDNNSLNQLAPEISVTDKTPPAFLVQTEDDPIHVENSIEYYLALKKAKVPAEMHLYPKGGHGYGLRNKTGGLASFPQLLEKWLTDNQY